MGFILLSAIERTLQKWRQLLISYDIACQFALNFAKRMLDFPLELRIDVTQTEILFRVPKFHLPAHGDKCQTIYSFNFTRGVGRTYGEIIESNWSETNGAALQSREMSPSNRQEFLDMVFGALNWKKVTRIGMCLTMYELGPPSHAAPGPQLIKSLEIAVRAEFHHKGKYRRLREDFPAETVQRWDAMIEAWDRDQSVQNPYDDPPTEGQCTCNQISRAVFVLSF